MDYSLPGSLVHGIFQARVLERVAISFSRGSSQSRDQTRVSRIVGRCFYSLREVPQGDFKKEVNYIIWILFFGWFPCQRSFVFLMWNDKKYNLFFFLRVKILSWRGYPAYFQWVLVRERQKELWPQKRRKRDWTRNKGAERFQDAILLALKKSYELWLQL